MQTNVGKVGPIQTMGLVHDDWHWIVCCRLELLCSDTRG